MKADEVTGMVGKVSKYRAVRAVDGTVTYWIWEPTRAHNEHPTQKGELSSVAALPRAVDILWASKIYTEF